MLYGNFWLEALFVSSATYPPSKVQEASDYSKVHAHMYSGSSIIQTPWDPALFM